MTTLPQELNTKSNYETRYANTLSAVRRGLEQFLAINDNPIGINGQSIEGPEKLWEAMQYSALDAGKLIRPVFTIETCLACGGELENVLPTACAIEMVHAQSLIHDDLPCMDNDDLRRGKPTVHKAFGESAAVLTGDALLAFAFGIISKHTPLNKPVTAENLIKVISDFSDVSSMKGLVNGQFVDIYYENRPFDANVLEYIHTYKTGALFRFSARAGARLAGVPETTVETFTQIGEKLGLAFQIVDDLLDIQSDSETMGKTVGKDQAQAKATYPTLFGIETSRKKAESLIIEANELLNSLPEIKTDALKALAEFIHERIH